QTFILHIPSEAAEVFMVGIRDLASQCGTDSALGLVKTFPPKQQIGHILKAVLCDGMVTGQARGCAPAGGVRCARPYEPEPGSAVSICHSQVRVCTRQDLVAGSHYSVSSAGIS